MPEQVVESQSALSIYDPNIRWAKQTVEIVIQQWDYTATFTVEVGGNCTGFSVIESAIESIFEEQIPTRTDYDDPIAYVVLKNAAGDELEVEDDDECEEEWLKNMVVSARIVKQVEEPCRGK